MRDALVDVAETASRLVPLTGLQMRMMVPFVRTVRNVLSFSSSSSRFLGDCRLTPPATKIQNAFLQSSSIVDPSFTQQTNNIFRSDTLLTSSAPVVKTFKTRYRGTSVRRAQPPYRKANTRTDANLAIELALDSVVKIFTVSCSPNYFLPWQNKSQRETMGSGQFVLFTLQFLIGPWSIVFT